jgi:solute:Na+ symporter, SSS family
LLSHENVSDKLALVPSFSDTENLVMLLIIPLAVQWWSVWYPGAEPGGGGYIAQRMLAARNEQHAIKATLLFNIAHYAVRPWPWILVALASLVVFPDLASLRQAFPDVPQSVIRDDFAYPAMLSYLPAGLIGIVAASLISAFMSTVSTHLNWGSSYLVIDFYKRLIKPEASEKELVRLGRFFTLLLMVLAGLLALVLESAKQAFEMLLQIGAGTGLLFILRWFWWRINAWSEITAMLVSFFVAFYFELIHSSLGFELPPAHITLIIGVGITTVAWVLVTLLTQPADEQTLRRFVQLINPGGPGWKRFRMEPSVSGQKSWAVPKQILAMVLGCVLVYSSLFATGNLIYGNIAFFLVLFAFAVASALALMFLWKQISSLGED